MEYHQTPIGMQPRLPNATAALVLGIISIPLCCAFGLVPGAIAAILGSKAVKLYRANPGLYDPSSFRNAYAGMVCGIIGAVLSFLCIVYMVVVTVILGVAAELYPF